MEENQSLFEFELDHPTAEEFIDTARWSKMFGIMILSLTGLLVLFMLLAWSKISELFGTLFGMAGSDGQMAMVMVGVVVLLFAAVAGVLGYLVVRAANRIRTAIRLKDQSLFNSGLSDLKISFIIYGIISILSLLANLFSLF
jgi:hypothetical protein